MDGAVPAAMTNETAILGGRQASAALVRRDADFGPLKERFGPARVAVGEAPFAALVRAVANQQLSLKAAATVYGRVVDLCRGEVRPETIRAASDEALRACGLSRAKVAYVRGIADAAAAGDVPLDALDGMDDEEVLATLTALKGVGIWTAQMLLIFTLRRPDVLPTGDLGVRDGARLVKGLADRPTEPELEELAEPWRPYRSVASWYLWKERDRVVRRGGGLGD